MASDPNSILPSLMNFISQKPAVASNPDLRSLMLPIDHQSIERARKDRFMKQAAEQSAQVFGDPNAERQVPYQLSPEEQFGDEQIPGLMNAEKGTGLYNKTLSPQESLTQLNQRMMASGNPLYQQQGLSNIGNMQNSILSGLNQARVKGMDIANPNTTQTKEFEYSLANPGFHEYVLGTKRAGANQMNVGSNMYVSAEEASKLRYLNGDRVLPYTPKEQLQGKVRSLSASEQKSRTEARKSIAIVDEMDDMLFGNDGIFKDYAEEPMEWDDRLTEMFTANAQQLLQTDSRYKNFVDFSQGTLAPFAKALGQAGSLSDTDLKLVQSLIPSITGLVPDTPQVAREKIMKLRRLVSAGLEKGKITVADIDEVFGRKAGSSEEPAIPIKFPDDPEKQKRFEEFVKSGG